MAWDPGARLPDIEQRGHEPRQSLLCVQIHTSAAFSFIPAELWTAPPSSLADISVVFHFSKARPARSQTEEPARPSPRPRLKPFGGVGRHPGIPRACVAAPLSLQQPVTDPPFSGRLTPRSHLSSASGGGEGTCKPHRLLLRGFIQTQVCWVQKTRHSQEQPGGRGHAAGAGKARRPAAPTQLQCPCALPRGASLPHAQPLCTAPHPHSSRQGASRHSQRQAVSGCLPSLPLQAPSMGLWGKRLLSPGLPEQGSQTRVEAIARPRGHPAGCSPAWAIPSPPCSYHDLSTRGLREQCFPPAPAAPQSACAPPLSLWDSSPWDPPHPLSGVCRSAP